MANKLEPEKLNM